MQSVRRPGSGYGELLLGELLAIDLPAELGWDHKNLFGVICGDYGTEGRQSEHEIVSPRRLETALDRLNPDLAGDAYDDAAEQPGGIVCGR